MNIHEHQAKEILKKYGAVVPEGVYALNVNELIQKVKILKIKIRSAQNVGKVWISRGKKHPAPFGAISGRFFYGPEHK